MVGSLVEKQLTTPQQYPLTLNSLTLACNQASNRDPVVDFGESEVQSALDSLKAKGLVRFVLPSHGRSVVRYRHVLDEKLALDPRQLALLAVLLLRGPQTVGELRTRTERMARFEDTSEVEADLEGLGRWDDPLVARLPRRPGQKEERWTQLLADTAPAPPTDAAAPGPPREQGSAASSPLTPASSTPASSTLPAPPGVDVPGEDVAALREAVDSLRHEVAMLREEVLGLRLELAEATEQR